MYLGDSMKKVFVILFLIMIVSTPFLFLRSSYNSEEISIQLPSFSFMVKEEEAKLSFVNFLSFKNVDNQKNSYLDKLTSCYDESYFYDSENDITILKYEVKNGDFIRTINIEYEKGNKCENEFVLDSDWYLELYDKNISSMEILVCDLECEAYKIDSSDHDKVLNYFFGTDFTRINNKERLNKDGKYILNIYYDYHIIEIFKYDNYYLAFNMIDENDASKNAINYYEDFRSVQKLFELLGF